MEKVIGLLRDYQSVTDEERREQLAEDYRREVLGWNRDDLIWMNDDWFRIPDGWTCCVA